MFDVNEYDKKCINSYIKNIINDNLVLSMKKFIHHGKISTFDHSMNVAIVSYKICKFLKLNLDIKDLLIGSILHDFTLYDWHDKNSPKLHGFVHSKIAALNAKKYFNIDKKVINIIESHMWPLNITKIPKSKEAIIVCIADKYCAIIESLFKR